MNRNLWGIVGLLAAALCAPHAHGTDIWSKQDYDIYFGDFAGPTESRMLYIPKDPARAAGISGGLLTANNSWPTNYLGITWSAQVFNFILADFNGDGFTDLLLQRKTPGDHYLLLNDQTAKFPGISQTLPYNAFGQVWSADEHNIIAGDFNGDTKSDVLLQALTASGTTSIVLVDTTGLFTASSSACGSPGGPHKCWSDTGSLYQGLKWSAQSAKVYAGKFNNDIKTDLLVVARPKFVTIDYDVPIPIPTYPPQMNGVIVSSSAGTTVNFSVGQYFSRAAFGGDWSPLQSNVVIGDFNKDGYDDVILQARRTGNTSYWVAGQSNGTLSAGGALTTSINWAADTVVLHTFRDLTGPGSPLRSALIVQPVLPGEPTLITSVTAASPTTYTEANAPFWWPFWSGSLRPVTAVGRTAGAASVSMAGEATYSIPINLPPGINGLTPALSVVYRHDSGTGLFGPNWNLEGLSAISRCRPNFAQDGVAGPLTLASSDQYCLDGSRLKRVGGAAQGLVTSEYRTELESFSKITVENSDTGGEISFKVRGKNGLTYEYGYTAASRAQVQVSGTWITRTWALSKIIDRSNNFIEFNYTLQTDHTHQLATIKYGGHQSIPHPYTIEVTQAPVSFTGVSWDWMSGEPSGSVINMIRLLDGSGSQIHAHLFQYSNLGNGAPARMLLGAVQECAASFADCLPPTGFQYTAGMSGVGASEGGTLNTLGGSVLDANGDGFDDIIYKESGTNTYRVIWGSASGYSTDGSTGHTATTTSGAIPQVIDLDSDGRMDLLVPNGTNWYWLRNTTGTSFAFTSLIPITALAAGAQNAILDVNGDGYSDLVSAGGASNNHIEIRLHNLDGSAGFAAATNVNMGASVTSLKAGSRRNLRNRIIDVDGDGRQDLLAVVGGSNRVLYSTGSGFTLGDTLAFDAEPLRLNGDVCTDLFVSAPATLYISKCRLTGSTGLNAGQSISITLGAGVAHVIDWDHDGYDDLLYAASGNWSNWTMLRSNTIGFDAGKLTSIPVVGHPGFAAPLNTSDIDGNGLDDLSYAGTNGKQYFHRGSGARPELVKQITDGYGNIVSYDYKPLTASTCYVPAAPAGSVTTHMRQYTGSRMVACEMTASNGIGGTYKLTSTYEEARVDVQGRGFLGFAKRTVKDDRTNITVADTYLQQFPKTWMVDLSQAKQSDGTLIQSADNTVAVQTVTTNGVNTSLPFVQESITSTYEVGTATFNGTPMNGQLITENKITAVLDSYGNPTSITTRTRDLQASSPAGGEITTNVVTNHFDYTTASTNWCVALPDQTTIADTLKAETANATSRTRTLGRLGQGIDYVGCRVTHEYIEEASTTLRVTTQYAYAAGGCGNVTGVTVTGRKADGTGDLDARTTILAYGSACRFPETITNAADEPTTRIFDYRLGVMLSETDPNGITGSVLYDGFGRVTKITRPDQTTANISRQQCTAANGYCGVGSDTRLLVTVDERDSNNGLIRTDRSYLDGYERPRLQVSPLSGEQQGSIGTQTNVAMTYDALGRVATRSVPYVSTPNGLVQYTYDIVGRQTEAKLLRADTTEVSKTKVAYAGRELSYEDPRQNVTKRVFDATGALRSVIDPIVTAPSLGGTTTYAYVFEANGVLRTTIKDAANNEFVALTNLRGFKTQTVDRDMGTWSYSYDSLGELMSQTNASGQQVTFGAYDPLGRPKTRVDPNSEGTTTWTWGALADNTATEKYVGRLRKIEDTNGYAETYRYDDKGRPKNTKVNAGIDEFNIDVAYNAATGFLETIEYPATSWAARLKVKYDYQNGEQVRVSDANSLSTVFWRLNKSNAMGQLIEEQLGNGLVVGSQYDATSGLLTRRNSGTASPYTSSQNLEYGWDAAGNLKYRIDRNQTGSCVTPGLGTNLCEEFTYDELNRLDRSTLNQAQNSNLTINAIGNITFKAGTSDGAGATYTYPASGASSVRPHAVSTTSTTSPVSSTSYGYDARGNMNSRGGNAITWYSYDLPKRINGAGGAYSEFTYTPDRNRWKQVAQYSGGTETTIYVAGVMERVTNSAGTYYRHLIAAGSSTVIHTRSGTTTQQTYYSTSDHLGSTSMITNSSAALVVNESFDIFGARRSSTWSTSPPASMAPMAEATRRGYTGHEHLDNLGLIHMNGRVQDPVLGRFISADPFVQAPGSTQSFNRYSYVFNNPLAYTDPSGFCGGNAEDSGLCPRTDEYNPGPWTFISGYPFDLLDFLPSYHNFRPTNVCRGLNGENTCSFGSAVRPQVAFTGSTNGRVPAQGLSDALYYPGYFPVARLDIGLASLPVNGSLNLINGLANGAADFAGWALQPFDAYAGELTTLETAFPGGGFAVGPTILLGNISRSIRAANAAGGGGDLTRVGRWMSEIEFRQMTSTERVVEGTGGRTSVIRPPNPASFKPPPSSTIYAEFDVPSAVLRQGGKPDWAIIPGPNIQTRMFGPAPAEMPPATCIVCVIRN